MEIVEGPPPPLPDLPCPLVQHPGFAAALRACGGTARLVQVRDAGAAVAQAVLVRRGPVTLAVRGPVWVGTPDARQRVEALRGLGLRLIEADAPDPALRAAGFRQVATAATLAVLDLAPSEAAQIARAQGKWRNRLMQAWRAGLRIDRAAYDGDPAHWLLAAEAVQRRRRYHALPLRLASAYAATNPGAAQIFTAVQDNRPVAAMLLLCHGTRATYHIGWSGAQGRACSAHHAILMAAAGWLAAQGVTQIELGTIDTVGNPGLARFKLGSGARAQVLGGSWLRLPGF